MRGGPSPCLSHGRQGGPLPTLARRSDAALTASPEPPTTPHPATQEACCIASVRERCLRSTVLLPDKRWYKPPHEPGWQGFRRLNAQVQVVVEIDARRHRARAAAGRTLRPMFSPARFPAFGRYCSEAGGGPMKLFG